MARYYLTLLALVPFLSGCPEFDPSAQFQSTATALITTSVTSGEAPLTVSFSGAESSSERGAITKYVWDFAGLVQIEGVSTQYTFQQPGRYPVTLVVTDAAGEQASQRVSIRVRGGDVTAVIEASVLSGPAPLAVQFDGRGSTAINDSILDYYWDFGDFGESRLSQPAHTYDSPGEYTVTLRAISAGGVEGTTTATISVTQSEDEGASLQFNGNQFATLPVVLPDNVTEAFTFETWLKPENSGGTIARFGDPEITIEVAPASAELSIPVGGDVLTGTLPLATGAWQHLAVTFADADGVIVYLDGEPVGRVALGGAVDASDLVLGESFRGNLARVRYWYVQRSAEQIAAGVAGNLSGFEDGLLGEWLLDDGAGQSLANQASGGQSGRRGGTSELETTDPAWSTDAP